MMTPSPEIKLITLILPSGTNLLPAMLKTARSRGKISRDSRAHADLLTFFLTAVVKNEFILMCEFNFKQFSYAIISSSSSILKA